MTTLLRRVGAWIGALCVVAVLLPTVSAVGQEEGERQERRDRGERGDRPRWGGDMTPEQMERMRARWTEQREERRREQAEDTKRDLGFSDEEFALIGPKIEAVQQLARESAVGAMMGGMGGRAMRDMQRFAGGGGVPGVEVSPAAQAVLDATRSLTETLDQTSPSADAIKRKMTALRQARAAMAEALKAAREDLRGLLTSKQEAQLVVQGVLD